MELDIKRSVVSVSITIPIPMPRFHCWDLQMAPQDKIRDLIAAIFRNLIKTFDTLIYMRTFSVKE